MGSAVHPANTDAPIVPEDRFAVGDTVYCNVRGKFYGQPCKIIGLQRGNSFHQDRIKIAGFGPWCQAYNFQRQQP